MHSKQTTLRIIYACVVVGCLIGLFRAENNQAEYTIKFAIQGSTQDEDYAGMRALEAYVERVSEGRVDIQLFPSGQFCGNVPECIGNLQTGVLEVFSTTVGGTGNFFAPVQVLDLPYQLDNDAEAECVLDGQVFQELRRQVLDRNLNLRLVGVSNTGGWRNFATVSNPIKHPEDLKGQKIRTTPAVIQQELVRQLGANPTPVSWSELYTALATGVVEGSKNGIQDIVGAKLEEHLKYIVLDGHSYMTAFWWFSEPVWQTLPDDVRQWLDQGFVELRKAAKQQVVTQEQASYQRFEDAGGQVYTPTAEQKQAFRDAASGMREWFSAQYGNEWLDLLDESVAVCRKPPNSPI